MITLEAGERKETVSKKALKLCNLTPVKGKVKVTVSAPILDAICVYLRHHKGNAVHIPSPVRFPTMKKITNKWDAEYINCLFDQKPLFYEVFQVAQLWKITPLVELCGAKMATKIKGQKLSDIVRGLQLPV